ncbi:MAG: thioredoxin domain-containing protein [Chloroflexi bacterium]|nr:thioredoxin domain-containing protein [Chloroflexota bacterium]
MSKQSKSRPQTAANQSINWSLIGGIIGIGVVALIGLLLVTVMQPPTAVTPTPALREGVNDLVTYCDTYPDRCLSYGPEDAVVEMVEVSDYGCIHCKNFNETSSALLHQEYVETDQMRYLVFPFALRNETAPSAEAVLCAAEQGLDKALDFHHTLFALQDTSAAHTLEGFTSVALQTGLDSDALEACVEAETYRDTVNLNRQAANQVGVEATPSFFINGRIFQGNLPLANFQQQIDQILGGS